MKRISHCLIISIILSAFLSSCQCASSHPEGKQVLVLTERGGQHGSFTDAAMLWLEEEGKRQGFNITEFNDTNELNERMLISYDLIIQLDYPPYSWTDEAERAFISCIENGTVAWIGFHHASLLGEFDGYGLWDWFSRFLGDIRYENYIAKKASGEVIVENRRHPVMRGVSKEFVLDDEEWYIYDKSPRKNVTVLASVDENSYSPASDIRIGDHPVVWTNEAFAAKNVYFQFGHSGQLFQNSDFVRMFRNAIEWTLEDKPGDDNSSLEEALVRSGIIHEPLVLSENSSYDNAIARNKTVLESAKVAQNCVLTIPSQTEKRPCGHPSDPDYATYGRYSISVPINKPSGEFNRISFRVWPEAIGQRNLCLEFGIGGITHYINLINGSEKSCHLELDPELLCTDSITFSSTARGKNVTGGDSISFRISDVYLEQVSAPYQSHGWVPSGEMLSYSSGGYYSSGRKTAISPAPGPKTFRVIDDKGRIAFKGKATRSETTIGDYMILDFSEMEEEGKFRIQYGDTKTPEFILSSNPFSDAAWKVLNFIFCQRCGYEVPGIHHSCHSDLFSSHNGKYIPYNGGWHDAGDLSQQTLQTGDVAFALLECYNALKDKAPLFAARIKEEARWGLEFELRNRYGDGYRASSKGLLHWTDGLIGSYDDIFSVRVQNQPFDNFLHSGYEAYAALTLQSKDMTDSDYLKKAAEEDFRFAEEELIRKGWGGFTEPYEHTYSTSQSLFMAVASWASSQLYKMTSDPCYANKAKEYADWFIECQQTEYIDDACTFRGFFWRDKKRLSIVHSNHQSREQFFVMALEQLCQTQPKDSNYQKWSDALRMYGDYIVRSCEFTFPYRMAPSGIYHKNEASDKNSFEALHIFAPSDAQNLFAKQLAQGVKINEDYYFRRFPISLTIFNGNNAVILSIAKSMAICGRFFNDKTYTDIALDQFYWISGRNPFCQSMIYGDGWNYPQMNSFSSGEIIGELPVGIQSFSEADEPSWPQVNNACYKEVWVTVAGKWLSLFSEFQ
ncbi:MAG: ThuA domain-containing protein [Candidatus Cryptobacteroides sp.]